MNLSRGSRHAPTTNKKTNRNTTNPTIEKAQTSAAPKASTEKATTKYRPYLIKLFIF
jgi:hypothetical protein